MGDDIKVFVKFCFYKEKRVAIFNAGIVVWTNVLHNHKKECKTV